MTTIPEGLLIVAALLVYAISAPICALLAEWLRERKERSHD